MFKNYLKIAVRNLRTHKFYSLINIIGLAIGLTVCILILLWVQNEQSYDRFHVNANDIYRVVFADESYDNIRHYSVTPPALAAAMKKDFPEVDQSVNVLFPGWYSDSDIMKKCLKKLLDLLILQYLIYFQFLLCPEIPRQPLLILSQSY